MGGIAMADDKPNIVILATGGTIAGSTTSHIETTGYKAGVLSVNSLIQAVPEITNLANIQAEQISNIDSADMTDEIWLTLAKRINILLESNNVDGIVITHGTDTMEETAFFLHLVTKSTKPVVLTGAMRPSSAMSADGPKNLYNAVALASSKNANNKGVMIVMNDRIQSARYATKIHTLNTDSFQSLTSGDMGYIIDGAVYFNFTPVPPHTTKSIFRVDNLNTLPKVDILYSYSNDGLGVAAKALFQSKVKGIVVAGSGAGSIHVFQKKILKDLMQQGLIVVQSSRVGSGIVLANQEDSKIGFIGAKDLNPQKARVLLMLGLTKTNDFRKINTFFKQY
ncbi:asparaginase [Helicobacter didelphidarum]|nr:asparaginase [Helicobacter didelphidarum]